MTGVQTCALPILALLAQKMGKQIFIVVEKMNELEIIAREAKKETGEEKVIVFNLSGTGYFDLYAYMAFNDGTMTDYIPSDEEIKAALSKLPKV